MLAERWSGAVTRFFLRAALSISCLAMISGCASMVSSKEELQNVGETEGIVFGSFVINVEKSQGNETGGAFLKGLKAGDTTYAVIISEYEFLGNRFSDQFRSNPLKPLYVVRATPGKEEIFIKKLPAGVYRIEKLQREGFGKLEFDLEVYFTVTPKLTTYIGKVTVQFPDRITPASPVRTNVADAQRETTELLKNEYGKSLSNVINVFITPLHDAAKAGNLPTVTELVSQNPRSIGYRDRLGGTALHVAVAFQQKGVAEFLLAKGADVNARMYRYGVTPLHIAAGSGYENITELLLANGADVYARNTLGQTSLIVAECGRQTAVVALLRAHLSKTDNVALAQREDRGKPSPC
ncbi:MAG: ankyrin repeat domain-containing protein [Gammaproteobacteria bacterium]